MSEVKKDFSLKFYHLNTELCKPLSVCARVQTNNMSIRKHQFFLYPPQRQSWFKFFTCQKETLVIKTMNLGLFFPNSSHHLEMLIIFINAIKNKVYN